MEQSSKYRLSRNLRRTLLLLPIFCSIVLILFAIIISPYVNLLDAFQVGPRGFVTKTLSDGAQVIIAQELRADFYTVHLIYHRNDKEPTVFVLDPDCFKWHADLSQLAVSQDEDLMTIIHKHQAKWILKFDPITLHDTNNRRIYPLPKNDPAYMVCIQSVLPER